MLDVKLSSHQRRQTRIQRGLLLLTVLISVLGGFLIAWRGGDWLLRRFIYENSAFAIHHLDVQTDGYVSTEQLRHWAGVKLQQNLLALDLARVKRDLELVPVVQAVTIERALPNTLRIRVTEREPIARVVFPRGAENEAEVFLIDADGYVMLPLRPHQRTSGVPTNGDLPLIVGVAANDLRPGKQVELPRLLAALQLIEAFDRSAMVDLVTLKEVDLTLANVLLVTTAEGSSVVFGLNDIRRQIERWHLVFEYARRRQKAVASLDLSVSNNVPATWLEASLAPPVPVRPAKPQRAKRRHV